jgi:hypothetical protein
MMAPPAGAIIRAEFPCCTKNMKAFGGAAVADPAVHLFLAIRMHMGHLCEAHRICLVSFLRMLSRI